MRPCASVCVGCEGGRVRLVYIHFPAAIKRRAFLQTLLLQFPTIAEIKIFILHRHSQNVSFVFSLYIHLHQQPCAFIEIMVSLRFSSLQAWLRRKGSKQEEVEAGKGNGTSSRERKITSEGPRTEFARVSGASSSANNSASSQEALDWAIGWYEPHGPGFCSDDSFAVLVPCYASPPQSQAAPALSGAPVSLSKSQLWADVLSKVAMETKAETSKKPPQ